MAARVIPIGHAEGAREVRQMRGEDEAALELEADRQADEDEAVVRARRAIHAVKEKRRTETSRIRGRTPYMRRWIVAFAVVLLITLAVVFGNQHTTSNIGRTGGCPVANQAGCPLDR